jgi:cation/acetate symporter
MMSLALAFQHENIGFLATLPLVIAASVNFPTLLLAMHWPGLTTRGAFAGGLTGLALSVGLIVLSKKVWVDVLGHGHAWFGYEYPTLFSLAGALIVSVLMSVTDRSPRGGQDRVAFSAQTRRSERGPMNELTAK